MTFLELVQRANAGYKRDFPEAPDLIEHGDGTYNCTPLSPKEYAENPVGDTLGRFIVIELHETFDPTHGNDEQLHHARRAMDNAIRNLRNVVRELDG